MLKFNVFTGQIECDDPAQLAQFWIEYVKRLNPNFEEQIKKTAEESAAKEFLSKHGKSGTV